MILISGIRPSSSSLRRGLPWLGVLALSLPLALQAQNPAPAPAPAAAVAPAEAKYKTEDAFPELKFDQPLGIATVPGEKQRLFVVQKTGLIYAVTGLDKDKPVQSVFLDLKRTDDGPLVVEGECGVLGLAFPPDFAQSKRCFVYYSLKIGGQIHQRVSRFLVKGEGAQQQADANSEQPLWTQRDPASNHNGGDLHFGPDGYLYISVGDGGAANDKFDQARFINRGFHAAILRIDVDLRPGSLPPNAHPGIARNPQGEAFYRVPADNPFVGATTHHGVAVEPETVRTEIWATGLRNPWRFSFDVPTGRLFTGDVGQNLYEEVNIITKGGDYGWSTREALHPFKDGPGKDTEPEGYQPIAPIFEYPRSLGLSITGGVVYRGRKYPELKEAYIFADYATGAIVALREKDGKWQDEFLARDPSIAGIGVDPHDGELLFATLGQGKIKRLKR